MPSTDTSSDQLCLFPDRRAEFPHRTQILVSKPRMPPRMPIPADPRIAWLVVSGFAGYSFWFYGHAMSGASHRDMRPIRAIMLRKYR